MRIISLVVGQLQTNCYLVSDETSNQVLVIDPGDDAQLILQAIQEEKLKPTALVATHGHFDHIMAVLELQLALAVPFYVHKKDEFLVQRVCSTAQHFVGIDPGPAPKIDGFLDPATPVQVGRSKLQILETPGHTPGGVSLYSQKEAIIFVGDTLFASGGVGRTDYKYATLEDLQVSIGKLLALPGKTLVYPGHGSETTIGAEKQFHELGEK
jgi:glyoxylase-like metal-dependent hydrolase (beta-lactamase superfamily II)